MLGSMMGEVLRSSGIEVLGTRRHTTDTSRCVKFDAVSDEPTDLLRSLKNIQFVVNCIGVIKPRILENDKLSRLQAVAVNSVFPHRLAETAEALGIHVIQIATDCVYAGLIGNYTENSTHDPVDIYGKTKSLGEVPSKSVLHLRASIIGPEIGRQTSLWEWVRSQPHGSVLNGFLNHRWNGVTTFHFAQICAGIIKSENWISGTYHVVPSDVVSKFNLVKLIALASNRPDLTVSPVNAPETIDRTLSTQAAEVNRRLWTDAGYVQPPSISEMVFSCPV